MSRSWDVLLLGGHSAAGKSTAAREIERQLGVNWFDADSLFIGLMAATTADQLPDVHVFGHTDTMRLTPSEELFPRFLAACDVVSKSISVVARHHFNSNHPAVIEATWITPSMAAFRAGLDGPRLRAVFVCDNSAANITGAMRSRWASEAGRRPPMDARQRLVHLAREHSLWLETECERLGLPVVRPRPRETVVARILAAANAPRPDRLAM